MADGVLPIEYYMKDKEIRDIIQKFHEMLDIRYKEISNNLRSFYQPEGADNDKQKSSVREKKHSNSSMLHIAQIHCEYGLPRSDDHKTSSKREGIMYGSEHALAMEQITEGVSSLFGREFVTGVSDDCQYQYNVLDTRSIAAGKNCTVVNGIAPHFCTIAWIKEPKRYQECKAIVRTVGPNKKSLAKGGADIKGVLSWSRYDKQFCKVVDNEDGTYHVMYSACSVRFHLLFITVNGFDVAGSPFIVDVDDDDSWD